jgi:hypothetical protein
MNESFFSFNTSNFPFLRLVLSAFRKIIFTRQKTIPRRKCTNTAMRSPQGIVGGFFTSPEKPNLQIPTLLVLVEDLCARATLHSPLH